MQCCLPHLLVPVGSSKIRGANALKKKNGGEATKSRVGFMNDPVASRSQRNSSISEVHRVTDVGVGPFSEQEISLGFAWMRLWVKGQPYHVTLLGACTHLLVNQSQKEPKPKG